MKLCRIILALVILTSLSAWAQVSVPITVQEALFPATVAKNLSAAAIPTAQTGIARTDEPFTVGLPMLDSWTVSASSPQVGITGATIGQFKCLATWPSGNCKWLLIDSQIPTLTAGGTNTALTVSAGTGNFGGSNLAVDNGTTFTITTGTATFTIRKANFDLFNKVVVGSTTLADSSVTQSDGIALVGPVYPATTCLSPPTDCTTLYSSNNDSSSTVAIEYNGPARAVLKADGALKDGSGNVYMRFTVRMEFYKGKSYAAITTILRNADESTGAGNFASATKGLAALEARVKLQNIGATKTATFATHTGTPFAHSISGSENSYLYQAYSTHMQDSNWLAADVASWITRTTISGPYDQSGYQVVHGATTDTSGTSNQYQEGWADLADSAGKGILIGAYQMSAYWPKALEFNNGGPDVRISIFPDQTLMNQSPTKAIPYYQLWPQYKIDKIYFNFHDTAIAAPGTEFGKYQRFLLARAAFSHYNAAQVFPVQLMDASEEDTYYSSIHNTGSPAVPGSSSQTITDWEPAVHYRYGWGGGSQGNQADWRYTYMIQFIERGLTGRYIWGQNFARFIIESAYPRADFANGWRTHTPLSDLSSFGFPSHVTSANRNKATAGLDNDHTGGWVSDNLHDHTYAILDWYLTTGDVMYLDFIKQAFTDRYFDFRTCLNVSLSSTNPATCLTVQREIGVKLMHAARMYEFFGSIGDTTDQTFAATMGDNAMSHLVPDLLVSGTGTSTTFDNQKGYPQPTFGTSRTRAIYYPDTFGNYTTANPFNVSTVNQAACFSSGLVPFQGTPLTQVYQMSMVLQGMYELARARGPNWVNYDQTRDLAYGMAQWATREAAYDDGDWRDSGFDYSTPLNHVCPRNGPICACIQGFTTVDTSAYHFFMLHDYAGDASKEPLWRLWMQKTMSAFSPNANEELSGYQLNNAAYYLLHPLSLRTSPFGETQGYKLITINTTAVRDPGTGSWTFTWTPPAGIIKYKLKHCASKTVVDWLDFDYTHGDDITVDGTFGLSPATNCPWFAAAYVGTQPASGNSGSFTVTSTDDPSLTISEGFMLRAQVDLNTASLPAVTTLTNFTRGSGSMVFPAQPAGTPSTAQVATILNSGNATLSSLALTITGTNASDYSKTTTCGSTLAAGVSCTFSVIFAPATTGTKNAQVNIAGSASDSPQVIVLRGIGGADPSTPSAAVGWAAYPTFGSQAVGTTKPASSTFNFGNVTLINTSEAPLTGIVPSITGTNSGDWSQTNDCPPTLQGNGFCQLKLLFTPGGVGARAATLTIASNAPTVSMTLSGTGTAPSGPAVAFNPISLTFSNQVVSTTSPSQPITLSNPGSSALTISTIAASGDFAQTNNCPISPSTLAAAGSCTVTVTFTPTTTGTRNGNITVTDNATGSPHTAALTGTGVASASPAVSFSPTSLAFGNQIQSTTSSQHPTALTNTGTGALTISSISITGTNSGDFAQSNNCGASLAQGLSCIINATFTPTALGSRTANISVADNAPGSPQTVPLTGTGIASAPLVSLSPTSLNFGNQTQGVTSAAQTSTLTNSGTATLNLTSIVISGDYSLDNTMTCPTGAGTVSASASCTIKVKFTPTTTGTRNGTVTITDNASGSPHSIPLTGNGQLSSTTPQWTSICNLIQGTDVNHTVSGGCTTGVTMPQARGYTWKIPYDTVNHEFLLYAGNNVTSGIYSSAIWGYSTTTHTFTKRADNGALAWGNPNDSQCPLQNNAKELTISSITQSTTVVTVVTSTPHGLVTNNSVNIYGVTGVTAYNGGYLVTGTPNSTTFTYTHSAGLSPGTGGTAVPAGLGMRPNNAFNPLSGHPLGFTTYDSINKVWIGTQQLCEQYTNGLTSLYDSVTQAMRPRLDAWQFGANNGTSTPGCNTNSLVTENGHFACNATGWSSGIEFVPGYGKSLLCCNAIGGGSTFTVTELDVGAGVYTDVTSSQNGTHPPGASSAGGMVSDGTFLWFYGGCNSGSPGNGDNTGNFAGYSCLNQSNDLYRYTPQTKHWDLMAPIGGNKPPATASNFPMIAYDSRRNRFVFYDPYQKVLWQYDIAGNTWSTFAANGSGPDATNWFHILASGTSDAAGYDPVTDTMVVTYSLGQSFSPGVFELAFGGGAAPSTFNLNVNRGGTGQGTITSTDTFISCGTTCVHTYNTGDLVVLTATANAGSSFTSWTVDGSSSVCPGTGTCSLTMTAAHSVTATFTSTSAPIASFSPISLIFGSQTQSTTSGIQTVTLTNTGNATLNITSVTASGDFARVNHCGATLAANANCTVDVTFTPITTGQRNGSLTFVNDASDSPQVLQLSGTGAAAGAPSVGLSPSTLNFSSQTVGITSSAQTTTLTNTGSATLNLTSIAIGAGDYSLDNTMTCPVGSGTLAASASCTIKVKFTPSVAGTRTGTVTIVDNAADSPQTLPLTGVGVTSVPVCISVSGGATIKGAKQGQCP